MLRVTKNLIDVVENNASKENSANKARELLRQGADITAPTCTGSMVDFVIDAEKRQRLIRKTDKADNCLQLIQVLMKEASDQLTAQVLSTNGGDLDEMYKLVQLKADCYQSNTFGPLGLLGSLLTQATAPIRLDIVRFLIENDSQTKKSLTIVDNQEQTCLSLAKKNSKCPQDVINYLQQQLDEMLNQIPFAQPPINPNEVIIWIRRGANIEATDKNRNTVLSNAVIANNLNLVRVLLTAGSSTTHKNADGLTPLQIAEKATSRNLPLIALLKEQNIDAELKQLIETKRSRLTTEEIQHLLTNGANINAKFANNDSPLHLLITNKGTPEMITAFVNDFHADVSATNANGYRPIETCILQDKDPFARLLAFFKLPKITADLFTNSKLNKTLLQFAIEQKRPEAANIIQNELNLHLWNCMARANTKEENNKTIMNEFNQLLNCGAQINYKHHNEEYPEWTVLHLACKTATQKLVQYMIKYLQADYTLQNHNGDYPISIAAEYGHLSILECLRDLPKSSVNVFNKDRQTPLHLATKNHHLLVVRYLVKWGADHQARNLSKQTPMDIARTNSSTNKEEEINDKQIILFLEQLICPSTVDPSSQQSNNAKKPTLDLDTCELVAPVNVNPIDLANDDTEGPLGDKARGIFSGTPNDNLHNAAKHGHVEAAQKAIGHGAIIHHRQRNRTPYEVARYYENKYTQELRSTAPSSSDYRPLQIKIAGCQHIAGMLQQIAQTKLIEAIQAPNPVLVKSYHLAGAILTTDLLYKACQASDNVQIVDYLINQDDNIYQALINDYSPNCPYRITKKNKFHQLSTYLKYRLSIECTKAIKQNNLQLVKKLVLAGASVDMQDTNNLTDILQDQNPELIQFLCDNGAKIPSNWFKARTILLEPTLSQQLKPEVVFSINRCLINRRLRFAAANGDLDGMIQCQRLGADIDSTNCHGSTALLCTIEHGNYFRIVHGLVSCGASMLHSNEDQPMSLIAIAKNKHYQQIDNYLSFQLNKQFLSSILDNNRQSAEKFAQLGATFDCQDEQERTPLHYAVQHHGVDLVSWLCEYAPAPTKSDINGDYPITLATEKGMSNHIFLISIVYYFR
jgi:ankyrin repeat protein